MNTEIEYLVQKYNVAAPRYTSYPTVPYWDKQAPEIDEWLSRVKSTFKTTNTTKGISVYVHLPFCESLCTYCGCNTRITVNHKVEVPYINAVLAEWDLYLKQFDQKPVIAEMHLGGGTPTFFSPQNLQILIRGIFKNSVRLPHAELSFEGHPSNTTFEHLEVLRSLGFSRVSFGIQDFDFKVQDAINRFQTFEEVEQVTRWARELGYYSVNYDLVYGLPFQTLEGIKNTINKINELKPDRIAFYSYAHVPWLKPSQRKFTDADLPEHNLKLQLYLIGREMFLNAGYVDVGMDHFSLPSDSLFIANKNGNLHRNFMGFTTNNTQLLIGLGVSAISDSWNAFAQNTKVVEEYQQIVKNGHFPIIKGHLLTPDDEYIRKQILEIICNYRTILQPRQVGYNEIKERLKQLSIDGLIDINGNTVTVTKVGQRFVRNIAMAFDLRYWQRIPESQIFSKAV